MASGRLPVLDNLQPRSLGLGLVEGYMVRRAAHGVETCGDDQGMILNGGVRHHARNQHAEAPVVRRRRCCRRCALQGAAARALLCIEVN